MADAVADAAVVSTPYGTVGEEDIKALHRRPGADVAAEPKAGTTTHASPPSDTKKSSPANRTKGGKKERPPESAGLKKIEAKNGGTTGHSSSPDGVQATPKGQKSSPDGTHSHKGKLKMPDGTYVGIEERNRYIRAMQKKHLQCHYTPFVFVGTICITMVTFLCIKVYFPVRHILGVPDETEEAHKRKPNTTTSAETTTVPPHNTSEGTSLGPTLPTANEATSDDGSLHSAHRT
ncbi:uncharacterized protein LOC119406714 [Rhipicephalus sanguineus]|uniref:uncharacterized protein LOC119406714 n=1 Tax=Rhipicephalus sanguineus TaxID=34632 RepID=UPI0018962D4C|nr:uncharacterized protein LOC119406714 [Rhipicephalus sanguineus]